MKIKAQFYDRDDQRLFEKTYSQGAVKRRLNVSTVVIDPADLDDIYRDLQEVYGVLAGQLIEGDGIFTFTIPPRKYPEAN